MSVLRESSEWEVGFMLIARGGLSSEECPRVRTWSVSRHLQASLGRMEYTEWSPQETTGVCGELCHRNVWVGLYSWLVVDQGSHGGYLEERRPIRVTLMKTSRFACENTGSFLHIILPMPCQFDPHSYLSCDQGNSLILSLRQTLESYLQVEMPSVINLAQSSGCRTFCVTHAFACWSLLA